MGKAKRFNTYDETVKTARERAKAFGLQRQDLAGIGSSFRSSPLPPIITTKTSSSQGVISPGSEFADSLFRIFDDFSPATLNSKLAFSIDGVPDNTTVTWFAQGSSGIVALLDSGFTQIFTDNIKFSGGATGLELNSRVLKMNVAGDSFLGTPLAADIFSINLTGLLEFVVQLNPDRLVDVFLKRIQNVNDPIFDLDAVNLRTLNNAIQNAVNLVSGGEFVLASASIAEFSMILSPSDLIDPSESISETVTVVVT